MNFFREATPVWGGFEADELNQWLIFRTELPGSCAGAVLRLACGGLYRLRINHVFVGYGPARAAHGYARVDEYQLDSLLCEERNLVEIDVLSYQVENYYLIRQPGFLQAEIRDDRNVIRATGAGRGDFAVCREGQRIKKAQRYGFQRAFVEDYDCRRERYGRPVVPVAAGGNALLPRRIGYSDFPCMGAAAFLGKGVSLKTQEPFSEPWIDKTGKLSDGCVCAGYCRSELEGILSDEAGCLKRSVASETAVGELPLRLLEGGYVLADMGILRSGLIGLTVDCASESRVLVSFEELLNGDRDVDFSRGSCVNVIGWTLPAGAHRLESIEPYALKYLKIMVTRGAVELRGLHMREYGNPDVYRAHFACSDPELMLIFEAARETFRQNAPDLFTDCPGRERAGWLCDSFFTARSAYALSGESAMERNFLENFVLPESFAYLPDGVLPATYPGDFPDGGFIVNWVFWLILELREYRERRGAEEILSLAQKRVFKFFDWLEQFVNADGLLENLPGWVFVEWSAANDFVQDVNYPSNMLWALALETAGGLWDRPEMALRAEAVRRTVREQSYDGEFFADHARRHDGRLVRQDNYSEICQYYAFYTGTATRGGDGELWRRLLVHFGPGRQAGVFEKIKPAAPFIGFYLRLELLSQAGERKEIYRNIKGYFLAMAQTTGTLWEGAGAGAATSCCHGFASHILHAIFRDVVGIGFRNRQIEVQPLLEGLSWTSGIMPLPEGNLSFRQTGGGVTAFAPTAYRLGSGGGEA